MKIYELGLLTGPEGMSLIVPRAAAQICLSGSNDWTSARIVAVPQYRTSDVGKRSAGRGRKRPWSFAQAMRVATTAEFFAAGFSLQMAHTLIYCLPLEPMLRLYDEPFNVYEDVNIKLISRLDKNYWTPDSMVGNIFIIDRRLVYGNILGESNVLYGIINHTQNRFYPFWNPKGPYEALDVPFETPAITEIN
jgi:hypothetical protein